MKTVEKTHCRSSLATARGNERNITNPIPSIGGIRVAKTSSLIISAIYRWIDENPDAWHHMCNLLLNEVAHKRRCSMQWAAEQARKIYFTDINGKATKINNTYLPALARIFVKQNPGSEAYLELRRSRFDEVL